MKNINIKQSKKLNIGDNYVFIILILDNNIYIIINISKNLSYLEAILYTLYLFYLS